MSSRDAPGHPGKEPPGITARKQGIGTTATNETRVWFAVANGALGDVSFPSPDRACVRSLRLIVTDGKDFFSDETEQATTQVTRAVDGVPAHIITTTCVHGRYRLEKEIICHSRIDAVIMRVRFVPLLDGPQLRVFAYLVAYPFKGSANADALECKGQQTLTASSEGAAIALATSVPFRATSVGFVGTSDGLVQLQEFRTLEHQYERAHGGYVALTGEIDRVACGDQWNLAVGFGSDPPEAAQLARGALAPGFDQERDRYVADWRRWQSSARDVIGDRDAALVATSAAVLKTLRDKRFPGGAVAALATPWGRSKKENAGGTYHLVWTRDLVECTIALLAIGLHEEARETVSFLCATQEKDGHWPQNMTLAGEPRWDTTELDEVALPILLVGLAEREGALEAAAVERAWPMVRAAASYIVRCGAATPADRWEDEHGFTPFTLGAEIAGLLVAARLADRFEPAIAAYLRQTADAWNESIERWLWREEKTVSERFGIRGYYTRAWDIKQTKRAKYQQQTDEPEQGVSADVLALVRFGLRAPDDVRIVETLRLVDAFLRVDFGDASAWKRYTGDAYGESDDGEPFKSGDGVGHPWPLLTGERAHHALLAGRLDEATRLARAMELLATPEHLLSEQIWDGREIPAHMLKRGEPTNSAAPLGWAHAEYLLLCRGLVDGHSFDRPPETVERYLENKTISAYSAWRRTDPRPTIDRGTTLRIELEEPSEVKVKCGDTTFDLTSRDTGLGIHIVDVSATAAMAPGALIHFSIHPTARHVLLAKTATLEIV